MSTLRCRAYISGLITASALFGCANMDVGAIADVMEFGRTYYSNYLGDDAAKIRVMYNSPISILPTIELNSGKVWQIQMGERTNKSLMGMRWERAPITLGIPGSPPKYNYTEIAVAPNKAVTIKFSWTSGDPKTVITTCNVSSVLSPQAKGYYQVAFVMANRRCWIEKTELRGQV